MKFDSNYSHLYLNIYYMKINGRYVVPTLWKYSYLFWNQAKTSDSKRKSEYNRDFCPSVRTILGLIFGLMICNNNKLGISTIGWKPQNINHTTENTKILRKWTGSIQGVSMGNSGLRSKDKLILLIYMSWCHNVN